MKVINPLPLSGWDRQHRRLMGPVLLAFIIGLPLCVYGNDTASLLLKQVEACAPYFPSTDEENEISTADGPWHTNDLIVAIHHNGEPRRCGSVSPLNRLSLASALASLPDFDCGANPTTQELDKYQVESLLTAVFATELDKDESCGYPPTNISQEGEEDREESEHQPLSSFLHYCDMGPDKTVVQNDHSKLVSVTSSDTLPCRWYTREGLRITSIAQLGDLIQRATTARQQQQQRQLDDTHTDTDDAIVNCQHTNNTEQTCEDRHTLHLYAVPAGRVFMFGPSFVGETFTLNHVQDADGHTVSLQVLSLEPRVFDIINFFNQAESNDLVNKALEETSETYRFHRSTTGTSGASVFNKRTSENAWDTHGTTASVVKRRCFNLLGIDEYDESMADGLQILRYNLTTAYIGHLDYLEDKEGTEPYDYDSAGKGGNRFATILLYFTDLGERDGGETVFPNAWPPGVSASDQLDTAAAVAQLRASGDATMLTHGSWEEEMTALCRTRFSVRPYATRAVLFYSQFPNGELDGMSFHGGCPVLRGTKMAANLWTWSGIRPEYDGAPLKFEDKTKVTNGQIHAQFHNTGTDSRFEMAEVYYDEDGFFGKLGFGEGPIAVNTYAGHKWNIKVNGKVLKTFVIEADEAEQKFEV